jgi:hypothetical protein
MSNFKDSMLDARYSILVSRGYQDIRVTGSRKSGEQGSRKLENWLISELGYQGIRISGSRISEN